MSTAISTSVDSRFLALNGGVDSCTEPVGPGDLTFISVPSGGSTTWVWRTAANEEFSAKTLKGLLVCVGNPHMTLWPFPTAQKGAVPLLIAPRVVAEAGGQKVATFPVAYRVGNDFGDLDANLIESARSPDGTYDAQKIPYFQWERSTGAGGRIVNTPPRAKMNRTVGILREGDLYPVFLRLTGTSVGAFNSFLSGLQVNKGAHYRTVVEFGLESRKGSGGNYSAITVSPAQGDNMISEEAGRVVKERYTDAFSGVVNFQPPAKGSAPAAAPATETIPF